MNLIQPWLKDFLEEKAEKYNTPVFIETDPISIPHRYSSKGDIEISGFLTSIISWGNRKMILRNASKLMTMLDDSPNDFILNSTDSEIENLGKFVHRTFGQPDMVYSLKALKNIYTNHGGLEAIISSNSINDSTQPAIHELHRIFFELPHHRKTERHLPDPAKGSAAKRTNMFLRWMVRHDNKGVDFGIWRSIPPSILSCPLDVHSGNIARKLQLLKRKINDNRAVSELDGALRELDSEDPVKYDFALFGLGIFEKF